MLIIKNYDGESKKGYIMYTLYEEMINLIGICDTAFNHEKNIKQYFTEKYHQIPNAIIFYVFFSFFSKEMYTKIRVELPTTKIIVWTDDIHWFRRSTRDNNYFVYTHCDYILSHYNFYKMFYNIDIDNKIIRLRHSCSTIFLRDQINYNSDDKIYMYGAVGVHYHLRNNFLNKMKKYSDKLVYYKHPGYHGDKHDVTINTAKTLYQYSFAFTSGSFPIFDIKETSSTPYYLVGKFFEIPGSGALLLCDDYGVKKELNEIGFYDMVNYININNENFDAIISFLFSQSNKEKINQIRKNGWELVKKKHSVTERLNDINKKIVNILDTFGNQ